LSSIIITLLHVISVLPYEIQTDDIAELGDI